MSAVLALGALLACGGGGFDATSIDDVRIVTVVAEPAEASPGERVQLTVYVANPLERELDLMLWTCLPVEDGCAEALFASEMEEWVTLGTDADGRMTTGRIIPSEAANYLDEAGGSVAVQLMVLACPVGVCQVIDKARGAMDRSGIDLALAQDLAHPERWLDALPMDGVALATRAYPVLADSQSSRNENPVFDARFSEALQEQIRVGDSDEVDMAFQVEDPNGEVVYAFPMSTVGSFEARKVKIEDDQIRLYLEAQDAPGEGRVWVVFDDRDGGLAVYTAEVLVED